MRFSDVHFTGHNMLLRGLPTAPGGRLPSNPQAAGEVGACERSCQQCRHVRPCPDDYLRCSQPRAAAFSAKSLAGLIRRGQDFAGRCKLYQEAP